VPGLLSPRSRAPIYPDVSERPALMTAQRVRRVSPRRRRRRLGRLIRRGVVGLVVVGALAGAGGTVHWLLTSPRFVITTVDVRGTSRMSPEHVIEAAAIPPGTNLFRLRSDTVVMRLERVPEIRRAEVTRALPNRVTIQVEERRPFTLVHAGRLHWMDEDGVAFGPEPRAVTAPTPVISGLSEDEVATMRAAPSPRALAAIALIRTLMRTGSSLLSEISEIDMSRSEGPVLYTVDGVEVRLGSEGWESRLSRLEGVLGQVAAAGEPVRSIDLRFKDQVVLKGER
jgi:cell division protein FtsQ